MPVETPTAAVDFEELKTFFGFSDQDAANLQELAPVFAEHGPGITDAFYANLQSNPATAKLIEGRVDRLKQTHTQWMSELFSGDYGEAYFNRRFEIGKTHVRVKLAPQYVEGVMTFLRVEGQKAIFAAIPDTARATELFGSFVRILDLDLAVVNISYAGALLDRNLERLTNFTGMSRKLLENCIRKG